MAKSDDNSSNADGDFSHREIGARLKAIRTTLTDLSIKDYAALLKVGGTRYTNWETGHRRLPPEEAIKLCERWGVTLDFIYRGIDTALPHSLAIALSSMPLDRANNKSNDNPD